MVGSALRAARRSGVLATWLVYVVALALALIGMARRVAVYDEGLILTAAERLLAGEVPHRDFWRIYPPGQTAAFAAVLAVTDSSLLATRVLDGLVRAALVTVAFTVARRLAGQPSAVIVACVMAVVFVSPIATPVHSALAMCLASLSLLTGALLRREEAGRARVGTLVAAGAVLAVAATFRTDFAAYAFLGVCVAALCARMASGGACKVVVRPLLIYLGTAAAGVAIFLFALVTLCGFDAIWTQYVAFPLVGMRSARWLPYPSPAHPSMSWLMFYLPLATLTALAGWWGRRILLLRADVGVEDLVRVSVTGFAGFAFFQTLSRFDSIHAVPCAVLTVLAVAVTWPTRAVSPASGGRSVAGILRAALVVVVIGLLGLPYLGPVNATVVEAVTTGGVGACAAPLARSACAYASPDQEEAVAYVQSITAPSDRIFVGLTRHDEVLVGDSSFYFLAGRLPATRYDEMHPGVTDTAEVQESMIRDLSRWKVDTVVLFEGPVSVEPNLSSVSSGVTLLDQYLRDAYVLDRRIGGYSVLHLRD